MAELAMFLPTDGENVKEALATHKKNHQRKTVFVDRNTFC